jgi:DNA invertase Pin-like site-specific DNA recombinase
VVDKWVEETVSSPRNFKDRLIGQTIREMLEKKISISAIGRILGVHRLTVYNFIKSGRLNR